MSLINDALKKAQQQRAEGAADLAATGAGMSQRNQPRGKSVAVLAGGAIALVVVSVGITVFLVNRGAPAPTAAVAAVQKAEDGGRKIGDGRQETGGAARPASLPPKTESTPAATAVAAQKTEDGGRKTTVAAETKPAPKSEDAAPKTTTPKTVPAENKALAPSVAANAPASAATATTPPSVVSPPPSEPAKPAAPAAPQDERIHQFLDTLRVAGVKAAGNDSRVLMNDKMFRVNEIVDRTLSLRLIKVEADNLTFSDINGTLYVKYF